MMTPLGIIKMVGGYSKKYNDPIVGGCSFKIDEWAPAQYEKARKLAVKHGFEARVIVTRLLSYKRWQGGGSMRIHIKEKSCN